MWTRIVQGGLFCLEEATGKELWKFIPPEVGKYSKPGVESPPSLSLQNGKVYLCFIANGENATVCCLAKSGEELWSFTSPEAGTSGGYATSGVAVADGWLYFGNDGGWVYVLTGKPAPHLPTSP